MKVTFDATGYVLVITGGANGIGRALALAAVAAGGRVIVLDADGDSLRALMTSAPLIEGIACDVSNRQAVFEAVGSIESRHGKIDGLVCGAAVQPRTLVHEMEAQEWERVQRINLDGVVWCYQAAVPGMIRRKRGSIIAFTSGLAAQGWPQASAYASTKAAVAAFAKSAAKEIVGHRVRFNVVSPGVIDTPQYRVANQGADNESWKATLGVGEPEDVVGPLLFLLSDVATMTGSVLSRDMAYARDK
ncbi:SDR family oxidoreductase [Mesorhizobium sp. M0659]|uniref:SDR family NAD(P)-dependent oxidoreductase n=1 Tax=Mesorhizobium sp. M0659 TaxID=2956980 RepID=UPI00333BFD93